MSNRWLVRNVHIFKRGLRHTGKMELLFTSMTKIHIFTSTEFDEEHVNF